MARLKVKSSSTTLPCGTYFYKVVACYRQPWYWRFKWFWDNLVGTQWKPNDCSTDFLRAQMNQGFTLMADAGMFRGVLVARDAARDYRRLQALEQALQESAGWFPAASHLAGRVGTGKRRREPTRKQLLRHIEARAQALQAMNEDSGITVTWPHV